MSFILLLLCASLAAASFQDVSNNASSNNISSSVSSSPSSSKDQSVSFEITIPLPVPATTVVSENHAPTPPPTEEDMKMEMWTRCFQDITVCVSAKKDPVKEVDHCRRKLQKQKICPKIQDKKWRRSPYLHVCAIAAAACIAENKRTDLTLSDDNFCIDKLTELGVCPFLGHNEKAPGPKRHHGL